MNSSVSKHSYFFSLVILAILFFSNNLLATQKSTTTQEPKLIAENGLPGQFYVNDSEDSVLFYQHIEHFIEKDTPLTIEDLSKNQPESVWTKSTSAKKIPSYGYAHKAVWLKFKVINDTAVKIEKVFEVSNAFLDRIDFYIRPKNGPPNAFRAGDIYPFESRLLKHNYFQFPVSFNPNSDTHIYIRVESGSSLYIPIEMWDASSINKNSIHANLINSGFGGICLIMFCFNFLLFLATKEIGYFYYAIYLFSMSILVLGAIGYGFQYLWPSSVWFQEKFICIFSPIMMLSMLLFSYNFLELSEKEYYIQWISKFWIGVSVLLLALGIALPWSAVAQPTLLSIAIVTPGLLLLAIKESIHGDPNAKLYTFAWLPVNLAYCIGALARVNIIDLQIEPPEVMAAIVFEIIFISLALAEKINRGKKEKETAQNIAIKNLEKYEELYEHAIEGMFSYNEAKQYFKCNRAFTQLFSASPQQDIDTLPSILQGFSVINRIEISNILAGEGIIRNYEAPIINQNSPDPVWVSLTIQSTPSEELEPPSYKGIFIDISERIKKEQAHLDRENAKRKADLSEEKNKAKSDFFASMSHEYRTPLNAILGFTQLLETENLTPSQQEMLSYIQTGGQDLLTLVNDVLDISKIEAQKFDFEIIKIDLLELIMKIESSLLMLASKQNIKFAVQFQCPLPIFIHCDPTRIKQAVLNLGANAIKFTKQGEVILQIRCDLEEETLYFSVQDTGIGIDPEQLSTLFDSYTQADSSISRNYGGTGLGLNLAKKIADSLGGDIVVESEFGKGSTFTFSVPTGELNNIDIIKNKIDIPKNKLVLPSINTIENNSAANMDFNDNEHTVSPQNKTL